MSAPERDGLRTRTDGLPRLLGRRRVRRGARLRDRRLRGLPAARGRPVRLHDARRPGDERMRVGTMLAIPELRRAPTNAAAIATVNAIAPGRTFLGLGTGFTGRAVFGMPRLPVAVLRDHALECRALLDGDEVEPPLGTLRAAGPLPPDRGPLHRHRPSHPVYVAADGPKALAVAGEAGDGLIVSLMYANTMAEQRGGLRGLARARRARPPAPRAAPPMTSTRCGRSACACSRRASPRSRRARSSTWVPAR